MLTDVVCFCRSLVCLLETARPRDCCWLQGWGGDRRPLTSSHPGIQMNPLPNNTETASPPVMNRPHNIYIHMLMYFTDTVYAFHRFHLLRVYSDVSFISLVGLLTADVRIGCKLNWHPMLMGYLGCRALHKMHACLHNMHTLHTQSCIIKTPKQFLHIPA